jgi:chromate transporter
MSMMAVDWVALFTHFMGLSLLAVGGAMSTAPDMHRYLVDEQHWLSDGQFSACIALAQAAPGPNVLFVALMGWNVGLNAAGGPAAGAHAWGSALLGALLTLSAILLPSSILTYSATHWAQRNKELRAVRAFKIGMAPVVIGLLFSTGWLLTFARHDLTHDGRLWLLTACAMVLVWRTKIHLLWLMSAGAVLGALGWV